MLGHLDPDFALDPHPTWDRLRLNGPVHRVEALDAWLVLDHQEVRDALRNPALSPSPRYWSHHQPPPTELEPTPRERFLSNGLFYVEPHDHVRLRRLLTAAFTPHGVEAQRSVLESLVAALTASWTAGDEVDLFADYFQAIPPRIIASMIGFEGADVEAFVSVARALVLVIEPMPTPEQVARIDHAVLELAGMVADASAYRRRRPADDLLSRLLQVEATDGDRLVEEERVALIAGLVIAGSGTTAQLMARVTEALVTHPDQLARVVGETEHRTSMLEEGLRWVTMGFGAPRFAIEDTSLGDHDIPAGSMAFLSFASANHDPKVFDDPHRFDVGRDASDHLAFSVGSHFCLGAALARLEAQVALGHLLERFGPSMGLAAPVRSEASFLFRDVTALPVRL